MRVLRTPSGCRTADALHDRRQAAAPFTGIAQQARDVAPGERAGHLERDILAGGDGVDVDEGDYTHLLAGRQHIVHEVHCPAFVGLRGRSAGLPHRHAPRSTPAWLQLQPFLDVEAVDFLVIDLESITPQHHSVSTWSRFAPKLGRSFAVSCNRRRTGASSGWADAYGFVSHHRAMDHRRATRSTLAQLGLPRWYAVFDQVATARR